MSCSIGKGNYCGRDGPDSSRFRQYATSSRHIFGSTGIFLAAFLGSATGGSAHEAVSGWSYPYSCCSGIDCREVSGQAISERPEGYVINGTGEVVAYSDGRVKNSPDGVYHWCSVAGADHSRTICLFVPPKAF